MMSTSVLGRVSAVMHKLLFEVERQACAARGSLVAFAGAMGGLPWIRKLRASLGPRWGAIAALASLVTAVSFGCVITSMSQHSRTDRGASCPAFTQQQRDDTGALALLEAAYHVAREEGEGSANAHSLLMQCVHWTHGPGVTPQLGEVRAQLECYAALGSRATAEVSDAASRFALVAVAALAGVHRQCEVVHEQLASLDRSGAASRRPTEVLVALGEVASIEVPAREALASADLLLAEGSALRSGPTHATSDVASLRASLLRCVLKSARGSRALSHGLPAAHPAVHRVQQCKPELLAELERLALAESATEEDPNVLFEAGLLMSEVITAPSDAPFFGGSGITSSPAWSTDSRGHRVPAKIVASERMLAESIRCATDEAEKTERAKFNAMRLSAHAKTLTEMEQYAAAELRYVEGSAMAKMYGSVSVAASSLAQLSYFLSLRGRDGTALAVAEEAVSLADDKLAMYLQATLRLKLGKLHTESQVREAADQLRAVEGRLPAQHLEAARAATHANLELWQKISASGSSVSCFVIGDAAQLMACILSRLAFVG